jgi:hypothetical protein
MVGVSWKSMTMDANVSSSGLLSCARLVKIEGIMMNFFKYTKLASVVSQAVFYLQYLEKYLKQNRK